MNEAPHVRFVALDLGGSPEPWARVGLSFNDTGACNAVSLTLCIDASRDPGMHGWAFAGASEDDSPHLIDGIPTRWTHSLAVATDHTDAFRLDVLGVDHVVVMTPDLERTSAAFTVATGAPLKRVRDAGAHTRQGFHRLDDVVVEIVSSPNVPEGPARLWGFVLTVRGLDEAANYLGPDVLSPPKPAVQEGRRIATFRQAAGLGVPVALMD